MSEILPPRIQTVIQIGSSDITAMMVQARIDGLKKEEADLLAAHQGCQTEMAGIYDDMCRRFQEEFESKRSLIDPLVASINALIGGNRTIVAQLCPSLLNPTDWNSWSLIAHYIANPASGQRRSITFKETTWESNWILVFKDVALDDDDDDTSTQKALQFVGLNDRVQRLTVSIPKSVREKINAIIRTVSDIRIRLYEIQIEMKDIPNLERKVQAALTQQLLTSQPDLVRQVNMAIASSGGQLLLKVQE